MEEFYKLLDKWAESQNNLDRIISEIENAKIILEEILKVKLNYESVNNQNKELWKQVNDADINADTHEYLLNYKRP